MLKLKSNHVTFCFLLEGFSPLRMLGSMASISFTTKANSLSEKLNANCRMTTCRKAEWHLKLCVYLMEVCLWSGCDCELEPPVDQRWTLGCWSAEWSLWPSGLSHKGYCPHSSSARSPLGSWYCWHTAWTCQTCSLSLGGGNKEEKLKTRLKLTTCEKTQTLRLSG